MYFGLNLVLRFEICVRKDIFFMCLKEYEVLLFIFYFFSMFMVDCELWFNIRWIQYYNRLSIWIE